MIRTFAVDFLGCKVNQYEAQAIRRGLLGLGLAEARGPESADLFVLNTCSVTGHAGATSRNRVRRAVRANPALSVLVTGCYAESDRARVESLPGVAAVFGNAAKDAIVGYVARDLLGRDGVPARAPLRAGALGGRTRAFIKIEDGCDDACSFCIIPLLRGPATSRGEDEISAEVEDVVAEGHREVVLTGVHLGYYGAGRGPRGAPLAALLRRLTGIAGLERLKISSLEVHELTPELIDVLAGSPVVAPHFHVPLQSGCDRTLSRMRRKYNSRLFARRLADLRRRIERPALSTDVIAGFPGETDADFEESLAFCRDAEFMKIHVFPYSLREGTEAARLPGHLPPGVIDRRKDALLAVDKEHGRAWRHSFLGEVVPVLVEARPDPASGLLTGLTDRYVRVDFEGPDRLQGGIVDVRVTGAAAGEAMTGERVAAGVPVA